MSDANRAQIGFIEENIIGTCPGTALTALRFTDESLNFNIENITSNEIRSDRQVTDQIQTSKQSTGGLSFELSYGTFDSLIEGAMFSDWAGVATEGVETITSGATGSALDFTLNATANTITFGASVTHGIVDGQWIELRNSTADDGYHFVTDVTGQALTVLSSPGITTGEVLDQTNSATIKGSHIENGTTEHGYSIERYLADKGDYFGFQGMQIDNFNLTAAAAAIVTGSMDFIGRAAVSGTASMTGAGAYAAATTADVMNAVSNVGQIMEGSSLSTLSGVYIQELSFSIANNLRGIQAIGNSYNVDVGVGQFLVTGALNLYYENKDIYDKYIAGTASGLSFKVEDSSGNAYIFTFPRIEFATDEINVGGLNSDIMENLTWTAVRHPTYGYTMAIDRIPA